MVLCIRVFGVYMASVTQDLLKGSSGGAQEVHTVQ
jgi:hypothetical protein